MYILETATVNNSFLKLGLMLVFQSCVLILYKTQKVSLLSVKSKNSYWSIFFTYFCHQNNTIISNGHEISGGFCSNYFHNWLTAKLALKPYYLFFQKLSIHW